MLTWPAYTGNGVPLRTLPVQLYCIQKRRYPDFFVSFFNPDFMLVCLGTSTCSGTLHLQPPCLHADCLRSRPCAVLLLPATCWSFRTLCIPPPPRPGPPQPCLHPAWQHRSFKYHSSLMIHSSFTCDRSTIASGSSAQCVLPSTVLRFTTTADWNSLVGHSGSAVYLIVVCNTE